MERALSREFNREWKGGREERRQGGKEGRKEGRRERGKRGENGKGKGGGRKKCCYGNGTKRNMATDLIHTLVLIRIKRCFWVHNTMPKSMTHVGEKENTSWNPNISVVHEKTKAWFICHVSEYQLMTRDSTVFPLTRMWAPGQQRLCHPCWPWIPRPWVINAGDHTQLHHEEPELTSDGHSRSCNVQKMYCIDFCYCSQSSFP